MTATEPTGQSPPVSTQISWRTLGHSITAEHRTALTEKLDDFIEEWIAAYNIGIRCIYWLAYALSIIPALVIAGRLHFTQNSAWPCCNLLPGLTVAGVVAALVLLVALTIVYEFIPSEVNFLSLRNDVMASGFLAIMFVIFALVAHHYPSACPDLTMAAGITGFVGCTWLLFLLLNPIIYPFLLEHWLNRLLISRPIAAIVYALKEVVRLSREAAEDCQPQDLETRAETVLDLEIAATAMRRGIPGAFKLRGSPTYAWLESEAGDMAGAIRDFQQPMIFPDLLEFTKVETAAARALKAAVEQDWSNFPRTTAQVDEPAAADWTDRLRLLMIALLPGAGVLMVVWLQRHNQVEYITSSVLFWSGILALAWCIFNLLRTLTPDLDSRISAFTTAIGALSPLTKQEPKK